MKTQLRIVTLTSLSLAVLTSTVYAVSSLPAPSPEFMSREQLAKWNADQKVAKTRTSEPVPFGNVQFYTGKPVDGSTGSYIFKYRNYDPELARWTAADPSGFPDGANNKIYTTSPVSILDPTGMANKSVVWISCYYETSDPNEYSIFLEVSGVTAMWKNNAQVYDRDSAATPDPSDDTHYLDDGDTFDSSSIGALSDLGAFSGYTQVYVFAHGIFNTSVEGNPFMGFGVGQNIYQASDFYNAASNVVFVFGCWEYNNGAGNQTTQSIADMFISPTLDHLYE